MDRDRDFPDWLRELEPGLAAEDTNRLYQIFRDRRECVEGGLKSFVLRMGSEVYLRIAIVAGVVVAAGFCVAGWCTSGTILLLAAMSLLVLSFLRGRSPASLTRMPYFASDAFGTTNTHATLATELWLADVRGCEILEAIYLENRAQTLKPMMVVLALMMVATSFIVYLPKFGRLSVPCGIAIVANVLFLREYWKCAMVISIATTVQHCLLPRLANWTQDRFPIQTIYTQFITAVGFGMWSILWSVILAIISFLGFAPVVTSGADGRFINYAWSITAFIFLFLLLLFWKSRRDSQRIYGDNLRSALFRADLSYEHFFWHVIAKDGPRL